MGMLPEAMTMDYAPNHTLGISNSSIPVNMILRSLYKMNSPLMHTKPSLFTTGDYAGEDKFKFKDITFATKHLEQKDLDFDKSDESDRVYDIYMPQEFSYPKSIIHPFVQPLVQPGAQASASAPPLPP